MTWEVVIATMSLPPSCAVESWGRGPQLLTTTTVTTTTRMSVPDPEVMSACRSYRGTPHVLITPIAI